MARKTAFGILNRCEKQHQYSNLALDAALKRSELADHDRALVTTLVYGVLERRLTLDYQISGLSSRPLEEITPETLTALRLGIYQLAYLDRIPDHAAVNETVALVNRKTAGFVNAILRGFLRRGKALSYPERRADEARYLSVRYSTGEPLCKQFLNAFGSEKTESILSAFEKHPPLTLRANPLRVSRDALLQRLCEAGLEAVPTERAKNGIRIPSSAPVTSLPGFSEGDFFVQDEASQLCVEALDARPGMRVLDTCACPGSKTFGIAMQMQNRGTLIAGDLHASKLSLVESGAKRLGLSILQVVERDARAASPEWTTPNGQFDRILCDVPCSGFGVLAKKPELRYKDPAESRALPDIQLDILCNSFSLLRAGGRLVYSTCTILPDENEQNLSRFLKKFPEAEVERAETFYPDTHGTDGFFVSVIRKREDI
jgi:16S rRNA (cytosine967-C5)-methyltransferase